MSEPHEQRTFIPDDDSAEQANWLTPRPRPRERPPLIEWLPGAIILIMLLIVVVTAIIWPD